MLLKNHKPYASSRLLCQKNEKRDAPRQTRIHRRLHLNLNISFDVQIIWMICFHRMIYHLVVWSINKRQALFFSICNLNRPIIIKEKRHQGYLLFTIALQFKCIFMFSFSTEVTWKVSVIIYKRKMCSFFSRFKNFPLFGIPQSSIIEVIN